MGIHNKTGRDIWHEIFFVCLFLWFSPLPRFILFSYFMEYSSVSDFFNYNCALTDRESFCLYDFFPLFHIMCLRIVFFS